MLRARERDIQRINPFRAFQFELIHAEQLAYIIHRTLLTLHQLFRPTHYARDAERVTVILK